MTKSKRLQKKEAKKKVPPMQDPWQRFETALKIHEFVRSVRASGGGDQDIKDHPEMMDFMMQFRAIKDEAQPGEIDTLADRFSGFDYFARMLGDRD